MAKLIGTNSNQVPQVGDLGTMAFQDSNAPTLGSMTSIITDVSSVRPSLMMDFANGKNAIGTRLGVVRTTKATVIDANGLVQQVYPWMPRFDHDPVTLQSLGLLIEESRTNEVFPSTGNAGSGNWSTNNGTTAAANTSAVFAPDGTQTATRVTVGGSVTNFTYRYYWSYGVQNRGTIPKVSSFWIRSDTPGIRIQFNNNNNGSKEFYTTTEWQRVWLHTVESNNGVSSVQIVLYSYANVTFDVWGFQYESGYTPSSYIPTTSSQVTRESDLVYVKPTYIGGAQDSRWLPQKEFTVFADYNQPYGNYLPATNPNNEYPRIFEFNGILAASGRMAAGGLYAQINGYNAYGTYALDTSSAKVAFAIADSSAGGSSTVANGRILGKTDDRPNFLNNSGYNTFYIGNSSTQNSRPLQGHIRKIAVYPVRLSDEEMVEITK